MSRRYKIYTGKIWFTAGAQKGVRQPDYGVRIKNRWYRVSFRDREKIKDLPVLDFGLVRLIEYLDRKYIHFSELPELKDFENVKAI